ncbi:protein translocase subunit SecDF [Mycoplasma struthionis]|uniref:Peptide transporter n=1 Tax=Mycoplasma struthionis TaxID=538220 RepID=A0A3G8LHI7_9MOLU|nr:peptide transporter [Mycoplasma struthionis]AZG68814.1 peptide transporter [Mycoplasma struthionis]
MKKTKLIGNKFRWFINIFVVIVMLLTIILGSIFYLAPRLIKKDNSKIVAANVTLKIDNKDPKNLSSNRILKLTKDFLLNKADATASSYDVSLANDNTILLKSLQDRDDESRDRLVFGLENKPYLTLTDEKGNPLFYKGFYISKNETSPNRKKTLQDFINGDPKDFEISLDKKPTDSIELNAVPHRIKIKVDNQGWNEFIKMSNEYNFLNLFNRSNDGSVNPQNQVYFWINLKQFIHEAKTRFPKEWEASGQNPVNFAYINNSANPEVKRDNQNNVISSKNPVLKLEGINARKYLISAISPIGLLSPIKSESAFYILNNNASGLTDKEIKAAVNFSQADFTFKKQNSFYTISENSNQNRYLVVLLILFSLFALFLIARHRLFGAISSITLGFFVFVYLAIITAFNLAMNPIISFAILAALFIVINMLYNQLNIYRKEKLDEATNIRAINKLTKQGLISGLDVSVGIIVLSCLGIFIARNYLNTISILNFILALSLAIIPVVLNVLMLRSWAQLEEIEKNQKVISQGNKVEKTIIEKIDLITKSKYFFIGFGLFIVLGLVLFGIYTGVYKTPKLGINLGKEFVNSNYYIITPEFANTNITFDLKTAKKLLEIIQKQPNIISAEIYQNSLANNDYVIGIVSDKNLADFINNDLLLSAQKLLKDNTVLFNLNEVFISSKDSLVNVAFSVIISVSSLLIISIYLAIRYSLITAGILFIKEFFLVALTVTFMLITRARFNNAILTVLIFITLINIIDTTLHAAKVYDEFKKELIYKNFVYNNETIQGIFKLHFAETFGQQVFNIVLAIVFIWLELNLIRHLDSAFVLGFGFAIISLSLINLFFIPYIWNELVIRKYQIKAKRIENNYWKTEEIEEETFSGINDFAI